MTEEADDERDDAMQQQDEKDQALLTQHVTQLMEHFDSVQVICTRDMTGEFDSTIRVSRGAGNWYARYGSVKEWAAKEEEQMRIEQRRHSED